jgi:mono/diheme cytochrome c family protein
MSRARVLTGVLLVLALAVALVGCGSSQPAAGSSGAPSGSGNSSAANLGQQIFTTGSDANGAPIAVTSGAGGPCSRCHGSDAKGAVGPDIRWSVLTGSASSSHAPRFKVADEAAFGTTVTSGQAAGNALLPMMPHYTLTAEQISALVAYLKTL